MANVSKVRCMKCGYELTLNQSLICGKCPNCESKSFSYKGAVIEPEYELEKDESEITKK